MNFLYALLLLLSPVFSMTMSHPATVTTSSNIFEVGDSVKVDFVRLDCRTQEEVDYYKSFKGGLIVVEVKNHLVIAQDSNCHELSLDQVFLQKIQGVPKGHFRERCRISVGDRVKLNWTEWRHCQYDLKPFLTSGVVTEVRGNLLTIKDEKSRVDYSSKGFWDKY